MESVKTSVTEKGKWEREIEVEVPAERVEKETANALRRYQKRLELPGFRKGKVPLRLIESRYGESIRSDVIGDMLPALMQEAAREAGLVPAAPPRITKLEHEPGKPLSFTAALDIWPEVEVAKYEGLEVTHMVHEVTDDEVAEQLKELQGRHATERSVERPLAKGDVLIADLQRTDVGGVPIVGDRYEERYFVTGEADAPSPEFEEALVGISAGEERQVRFTYRQDLPNPDLAGKEETFRVKAREVRERSLPALDDEFARDLGDQFKTLEELRTHLRSQLVSRWEYASRQRLRAELLDQLIRHNPLELPESLVENYIETMRREREEAQRRRGPRHRHDDHDHDLGGEDEEIGEEERQTAARRLKTYLILEGLRKKLEVKVTDEEFEEHLRSRAESAGMKLEDIKRSPRIEDLRRDLEEERIFAHLGERAVTKEEKI
ncbi:MAG: trigger factor [Gemmatimonadota bacterium]